jgi:exodeoxyribonuclease-3
MATWDLVSWNVNGIRAVRKKGFLEWLETASPTVVCLQETKIDATKLTEEIKTFPHGKEGAYHTYWAHAEKKGYSGVAILTQREPLSVTVGLGDETFDREGRTLIADFGDFVLYNIYFPNGNRDAERLAYKMAFYEAFQAHAQAYVAQGRHVVVCGDYNTAHYPIDLARPQANQKTSGFLPEERAWMDRYVEAGFVDTFRHFHPDAKERYTWWDQTSRARDRNVGWRIDYFFMSQNGMTHATGADTHDQVFGSDHCPVSLQLKY